MKKAILLAGLCSVVLTGLHSCSKGGDDEGDECDLTIANVAGKYTLVSAKYVNGDTETDALHDLYDDCELDDTNELKADKTFIYSDAGTSCSPSGSTSGTWDISGTTLILNSGFSEIEHFDCQTLVVSYMDGSQQIRETYRKQ